MRKHRELSNPNSCLNKALLLEPVFVLLGRDAAAPAAIQAWIDERIRLGLNKPTDMQIQGAERAIAIMNKERVLDREETWSLRSEPVFSDPDVQKYAENNDLFL